MTTQDEQYTDDYPRTGTADYDESDQHVTSHDLKRAEHLDAIPVRITRDPSEGEKYVAGAFSSVTFAGGEQPYRLLPQDKRRVKAVIRCNGAAPNTVVLAAQSQVAANQGYVLTAGDTFTYTAHSEVWVVPQAANGAVQLSIIVEREVN